MKKSFLLCGRVHLLHRGAGCWQHPAPCLYLLLLSLMNILHDIGRFCGAGFFLPFLNPIYMASTTAIERITIPTTFAITYLLRFSTNAIKLSQEKTFFVFVVAVGMLSITATAETVHDNYSVRLEDMDRVLVDMTKMEMLDETMVRATGHHRRKAA